MKKKKNIILKQIKHQVRVWIDSQEVDDKLISTEEKVKKIKKKKPNKEHSKLP